MRRRSPSLTRITRVALLATPLLSASLLAGVVQAAALKADDAIKLRRAAYQLQGHYFAQLKEIALGRQPFEAAQAQQLIQRVQQLSQMTPDFFVAGSHRGNTQARPEIWTQAAAFDERRRQSALDVDRLAVAIQTGDPQALKAAYLQAAGSCKACHDDYRKR